MPDICARIEAATHAAGRVKHLRLVSRDAQGREYSRRTRSVVVGSGGTPKIPEKFGAFKDDPRVFHHSQYLSSLNKLPCTAGKPMRIAVIGSGRRLLQRSFIADGGQTTICPSSEPLGASLTSRSSPRSMP